MGVTLTGLHLLQVNHFLAAHRAGRRSLQTQFRQPSVECCAWQYHGALFSGKLLPSTRLQGGGVTVALLCMPTGRYSEAGGQCVVGLLATGLHPSRVETWPPRPALLTQKSQNVARGCYEVLTCADDNRG